jgi:hypothetical protein
VVPSSKHHVVGQFDAAQQPHSMLTMHQHNTGPTLVLKLVLLPPLLQAIVTFGNAGEC